MKNDATTGDFKFKCSYEVKYVLDTPEKYKSYKSEIRSNQEISLRSLIYEIVSNIIDLYSENYNCKNEDDFEHFVFEDFNILQSEIDKNKYLCFIWEKRSEEKVYLVFSYMTVN